MPRWGLRFITLGLAIRVFCSSADLPDANSFEGKRIVAIRFEPPAQPLTAQQLSGMLPIKPNTPYRGSDLRDAIQRLYATGRYDDIAAFGEPAEGGVAVIFRTTDQWFIARVSAEGKLREPPTIGQVEGATGLDLGRPFAQDELQDAAKSIHDLLVRNGFYHAQIDPQLQRDPQHQQVNITFDVKTGKRAKYTNAVITGQPGMEAEDVAHAAKFKSLLGLRWKQVTEENTQSGLQRIRKKYAGKDRLMASVKLQGMKYDPNINRVSPQINVIGGPKVKIESVGAKVSQKNLKKYVPIFDEGAVDRDLLVEGARNLRDYFQTKGYFDVEIDFQQKRISQDEEHIVYVVNLGRRQKLVSVQIVGNKYFPKDTITERMFVQPSGFIRWRHGRYSEGFVRSDTSGIKALYQSNGFRDVKVNFQTIDDFRGKRDEMAVVVNITEGPQYFVSAFNLNGVSSLDRNQIVSMLSSEPGQPYSENNVGMDRDYILGLYNSAGFPDASFDWSVKPGPGDRQFQVQYTIKEGRRRYVRDVLVAGLHETRWRLVKPAMRLQAGQPLSLTKMTDTQKNLYDLGIFDKVDTAIQNPGGETDRKYVLYQIDEGHRWQLATGFGAEIARIGGSQTSYANPAGQTGFAPRVNLDLSRLNMWGLGHTLNFKARGSTLERMGSLNYLAPRYRNVDGRNISATLLYDDSRLIRTFTSRRVEGSLQLSQKLSKASTVLWRYSLRRSSVSNLKIDPLLVPLLQQPARVGIFETNFMNDRRDDPTDAHKGIYTTLDAGLAAHALASRRNFGKFLATNSSYHTFGKNFVLARRIEVGWLAPFNVPKGLDTSTVIPVPERFFGGGSTSHRGFPDNQAGPRDPFTGFPLGGNTLLFHNTELRFPLLGDNIDGVFFHDMGNVYASPGHISFRVHQKNLTDFDYMVHAVGFGIRYRTPVGPIRIDLAYSINPPRFFGFKGTPQQLLTNTAPRVEQGISHFQFFFSIGQAF